LHPVGPISRILDSRPSSGLPFPIPRVNFDLEQHTAPTNLYIIQYRYTELPYY
jgi:hypothetical protein